MSRINEMLTLSTAHLSEKTRSILDAALKDRAEMTEEEGLVHDNIVVYPKQLNDKGVSTIGYFVYVPDKDTSDVDSEALPSDLRKTLEFARKKNCSIICFDRDEIDSLPIL